MGQIYSRMNVSCIVKYIFFQYEEILNLKIQGEIPSKNILNMVIYEKLW